LIAKVIIKSYYLIMTLNAVRVDAWLKKNDRSREWLADQLDVSFALVTRMLAGKVPKTETMMALAHVMGCKVEDLLTQKNSAKQTA
jgi:DNA-binding Xre family transcriptional regulator